MEETNDEEGANVVEEMGSEEEKLEEKVVSLQIRLDEVVDASCSDEVVEGFEMEQVVVPVVGVKEVRRPRRRRRMRNTVSP